MDWNIVEENEDVKSDILRPGIAATFKLSIVHPSEVMFLPCTFL